MKAPIATTMMFAAVFAGFGIAGAATASAVTVTPPSAVSIVAFDDDDWDDDDWDDDWDDRYDDWDDDWDDD